MFIRLATIDYHAWLATLYEFHEKLSSTVRQLTASCHNWASTFHSHGQTDRVLVLISILIRCLIIAYLQLLSYNGIFRPESGIDKSFLNDRFQAVTINGSHLPWGENYIRSTPGLCFRSCSCYMYIHVEMMYKAPSSSAKIRKIIIV